MPLSALFPAGLAPFLLLVALAVRFSAESKILNSVDYERIVDRAAFHRWAGNRLFIMPLMAGITVLGAMEFPHVAPLLVVLFFFSVVIVGIAVVAVGTTKFANPVERS